MNSWVVKEELDKGESVFVLFENVLTAVGTEEERVGLAGERIIGQINGGRDSKFLVF
jgi:hypothetical protein